MSKRGTQTIRAIKLAIKLSQRFYKVSELVECDCRISSCRNCRHTKAIYRDLRVLESAGIPIIQDDARYSVDHHFMRRFL